MVKVFKESHENDVERLDADRRCETIKRSTRSQKRSQAYCPVHERSNLTSVDYVYVSDGDRGFLPVHETHQTVYGL